MPTGTVIRPPQTAAAHLVHNEPRIQTVIVIVEPADTVGDVLDQMRADEALFVVHVDAPRLVNCVECCLGCWSGRSRDGVRNAVISAASRSPISSSEGVTPVARVANSSSSRQVSR